MLTDRKNYGIGYVNEDNKLVLRIPCIYSNIKYFNEGFAIVEIGTAIGFVSKDGNSRLFSKKNQYLEIRSFNEGLAAVKNIEGLWGFINNQGEEIIPCKFKQVDDFSEGVVGVFDQYNNLYYIDKLGNKKIELPLIYCSLLEIKKLDENDIVVSIEGETEEELNAKKLQVLSIAKKEILANLANHIDQVAYDITVTGMVKTYKKG